ncbi:MAG: XRE family transcriptional regulator [Clostridia bacterium]|nr:XRE family transcriptional regulator [Clostridia bacterium]
MDILSNFSETLSELIAMHNLNASILGKQLKIDRSTITKYLAKRSLPKLQFAIKIVDYFGCSLDYLFGLTNDYQKKSYLQCPPFFQVFQQLLASRNCSRYRLFTDLDIHDQIVDDWYYGRSIPSMYNIIRLANYFNCTLDELVGRKAVE